MDVLRLLQRLQQIDPQRGSNSDLAKYWRASRNHCLKQLRWTH